MLPSEGGETGQKPRDSEVMRLAASLCSDISLVMKNGVDV